MEQEQSIHTSALFATCVSCSCPSITNPHLAIKLSYSELKSGNAVAISYTWGEFDRRDVCIGHPIGQPSARLFLNLGQEWDIPEFLQRLAELSHKHNAIWLDQLCISQNTADIQLNLARIPTIYSTLNVIAILPGSPPCRCFREHVQERQANIHRSSYSWNPDIDEASEETVNAVDIQEGEQGHHTDVSRSNFSWQLGIDEVSGETMNEDDIRADHDENELSCLVDCQNAIGLCSWLNRIWTRQEFAYSNHISISWNSTTENPCTNVGFRETKDLAINRFYQLTNSSLRRQISERSPYPSGEVLDRTVDLKLQEMTAAFFKTGRAAVDQYTQTEDPGLSFAEFLLGKPLESKQTFEHALGKFFHDLHILATSTRTATKPCDFVLAVWCDCPGYTIPRNCRTAKPFDLLEDAIKQLEQNHFMTLLTTCPNGLFSDTGPSVSWRSLAVSQSSNLANAKDMYAMLTVNPDEPALPLVGGAVPLRLVLESPVSVGLRAGYYESLCGDWTTVQALCIMSQAVGNFDQRTRSLVDPTNSDNFETEIEANKLFTSLHTGDADLARPRVFDRSFLDKNEDALASHFESLLSWYAGDCAQEIPMAEEWRDYPELDHHSLIYKIVARVLNLDYDLCRSQGLKLMIAVDDPVRIGLVRGHHHFQSPRTADERANSNVADNSIHATRAGLADTMTVWNFETQRIFGDEVDRLPKYRVVGIWAPCHGFLRDEVGAEPAVEESEVGAWLV